MALSEKALQRIEVRIRANKPITKADKRALLDEVRERRPVASAERALLRAIRKGEIALRASLGRGRTPGRVQAAVTQLQKALDDYAA